MDQGEVAFAGGGNLRQAGQPAQFVRSEAGGGPQGGGAGGGVEQVGVKLAGSGVVVVAGHGEVRMAPQPGDAGAGVGAVAHQVAQEPDNIPAAVGAGVGQDGVKGFQVGMDVGKDEGAHRRP